jgi:hypothetical protein
VKDDLLALDLQMRVQRVAIVIEHLVDHAPPPPAPAAIASIPRELRDTGDKVSAISNMTMLMCPHQPLMWRWG